MNVQLKRFHNEIEVKNNGVEFGIWDTSGKHLGDIYVRRAGLVWCEGKKSPKGGKPISWKKFVAWANTM